MTLWFFRGIRRGVVTTRYPAVVDSWAHDLPSPPAFDSHLLTEARADRLVLVCPSQALRKEGDELVLDLGACTGCGRCFGEGVRPSGEFELTSRSRERLIKRILIGGGK
jgi:dissimilatory sulfite reductase (desulfoviridin) alpha/beta subunit